MVGIRAVLICPRFFDQGRPCSCDPTISRRETAGGRSNGPSTPSRACHRPNGHGRSRRVRPPPGPGFTEGASSAAVRRASLHEPLRTTVSEARPVVSLVRAGRRYPLPTAFFPLPNRGEETALPAIRASPGPSG
jgi:hypothetical protein